MTKDEALFTQRIDHQQMRLYLPQWLVVLENRDLKSPEFHIGIETSGFDAPLCLHEPQASTTF